VQHYTEADLEQHFALKGTKVIGFKKSALAQAIYAELKPHRINKPFVKPAPLIEAPKMPEATSLNSTQETQSL
jgi:hypothetical protein